MTVTLTLTEQEAADIAAEIAAIADPKPTVSEYMTGLVRAQILNGICSRQAQYRIDGVINRLRVSGLADKLAALPADQQDAIQVMVERALAG